MLCKMHMIESSVLQPESDDDETSPLLLPPPKDNFEVGERISVFWMVCTRTAPVTVEIDVTILY